MSLGISHIVIGVGSESGNASGLAARLAADPSFRPFAPRVEKLATLDIDTLGRGGVLVIISSSFGDGEPPATAEGFLERLNALHAPLNVQYAIFGLGDVAYPNFCGFTKTLDAALAACGSTSVVNRVDADTDYEEFFDIWRKTLLATLKGDREAGKSLALQVKSYGENSAYRAPIVERERLNGGAPYAWHYRFDIAGSGIKYRAGDNLYVVPANDPGLLSRLADWFGSDDAYELFGPKEIRNVGKSFLRNLARLAQNDALKELLKSSNRASLETYLYGRDLLDLLMDFCARETVTASELAQHLPDIQPRAYSIASDGDPNHVDLCVREVSYNLQDRDRQGAATGFLGRAQSTAPIFVRANPRFRLPADEKAPVIMIGTGTGIGPYMGLLKNAEQCERSAETCLIFGDRRSESDFLYEERIRRWQGTGLLSKLITAFSRDGNQPYYVQHALFDNSKHIWRLLDDGAHVYVCGSKTNLGQSIDDAIHRIAVQTGDLTEDLAHEFLLRLNQDQRLHKELY
ncbi:sulfite reductase flavoprotein subunit alpha (plasmid) [Aliirhizobium terrae]|uniref:diflavin oxidoreductase n=1 Tax=Terrirhizobium terrae TaxID=2926709 RepID=UPI0025767675|nr:sulfite reductase flavoprotein subunit alpha [Rhizobium sp. CC-CFT758]WJH38156.1 sulfite reductase flavoprotein subunit alpha [Rhizobium sp. CC-CFT758]